MPPVRPARCSRSPARSADCTAGRPVWRLPASRPLWQPRRPEARACGRFSRIELKLEPGVLLGLRLVLGGVFAWGGRAGLDFLVFTQPPPWPWPLLVGADIHDEAAPLRELPDVSLARIGFADLTVV